MELVDCPPWRLLVDREATLAAHALQAHGAPEGCECSMCRNFAANRGSAYPKAFLDLLRALGVPPDRESEVYYLGRSRRGAHWYGGWFHLVGEITSGPASTPAEGGGVMHHLHSLTDVVSIGFHPASALIPDSLKGFKALQLEFHTEIPWTISEPEPD